MGTGSVISGKTQANIDFSLEYLHRIDRLKILEGNSAAIQEIGIFGDENTENRLYAGDNLNILRGLCNDNHIKGKVRLVYIDPPFATGMAFESATVGSAYSDHVQGAGYIESLRQRIIVLRELLAQDGSMYLHLDSKMIFPAKLIMDEVFGSDQFRSLITRVKCNPKNQARRQYGDVCDYLLFYSKTRSYIWNQPVIPWDEEAGRKEYAYVEESTGRSFKKVPCHLPGVRFGATGTKWKGKLPPPGKHWVHSPAKLDEMDRKGEIYWSATGNPRRKLYLDEAAGKRQSNLWSQFRDTQNQNAKVTGYPTEKNPDMLSMIVKASSGPGDLILDAYAGSGTTLAAAGESGRTWVGIDESPVAIETTVKRLVLGTPTMGSHAKNNYAQRELAIDRQATEHSFRVFLDAGNKPLAKSVTSFLKKRLLTSAFKPV